MKESKSLLNFMHSRKKKVTEVISRRLDGKLGKGQVYKNDLFKTDYTRYYGP